MTDHPITPPPELIKDWHDEWNESDQIVHSAYTHIAIRAAQWGADQELTECCKCIYDQGWFANPEHRIAQLRAARRPKPPSLKEQALALLDPSNTYGSITQEEEYRISVANAEIIRRALEALPDD